MENAMITMKNINKGYIFGRGASADFEGHQFSGK